MTEQETTAPEPEQPAAEPEAEAAPELASPTSNDVGEQTATKADLAEAEAGSEEAPEEPA